MHNGDGGARGQKPLSLAEVYAVALRRAVTIPANISPAREKLDVAVSDTPEMRALPSTGWKQLFLPYSGSLTIDDMREVFSIAFTAAGSPKGAAMYRGAETKSGWTVYFSPTAEKIFGSVMVLKGAVDCDQPIAGDAALLCGNEE
ncbi:hypothetical protein DY251_18625 [Mesorhizobium denitrificans]|uniref:Uncharacterized protein n=1 Tax=Mesorhizobium denitrificans TaxID=2294114 RepID=A0A371X6D7_9HYPH|nr:hypothetical protein DY251_18625 [Mesorhizobium denitrificans]